MRSRRAVGDQRRGGVGGYRVFHLSRSPFPTAHGPVARRKERAAPWTFRSALSAVIGRLARGTSPAMGRWNAARVAVVAYAATGAGAAADRLGGPSRLGSGVTLGPPSRSKVCPRYSLGGMASALWHAAAVGRPGGRVGGDLLFERLEIGGSRGGRVRRRRGGRAETASSPPPRSASRAGASSGWRGAACGLGGRRGRLDVGRRRGGLGRARASGSAGAGCGAATSATSGPRRRLGPGFAQPSGRRAWGGGRLVRFDLHRRRQAGDELDPLRNLVDVDAHRHALGEAHEGEDRIDRGEPGGVGRRVGDIDAAREPLNPAAQERAIAHELDRRRVAFLDAPERGLLEIGVDPVRVRVDDRELEVARHWRSPRAGRKDW